MNNQIKWALQTGAAIVGLISLLEVGHRRGYF
jgi:hypothetical protein